MIKNLTCLTLVVCLMSAKIFQVDIEDLPKLMSSIESGNSGQALRHLSEKDSTTRTFAHFEEDEEKESEPNADDGSSNSVPAEPSEPSYVTVQSHYTPIICDYRGEKRFGYEVDGDHWMMGVSGKKKCRHPDFPKFVKIKKIWDDLSDCKGIPYKYKEDDEVVTTTLYYVFTNGESTYVPTTVPGYLNGEYLNARMYMFDSVFNYKEWMGPLKLLCLA